MLVNWSMDFLCNRLEVLFQFYLWDQFHVTIVWNTRETGDLNKCYFESKQNRRYLFCNYSHCDILKNDFRSNSGTCSPKDQGSDSSLAIVRRSGAAAGFQSLRDAVWTRVAQTILMQVSDNNKQALFESKAGLSFHCFCALFVFIYRDSPIFSLQTRNSF